MCTDENMLESFVEWKHFAIEYKCKSYLHNTTNYQKLKAETNGLWVNVFCEFWKTRSNVLFEMQCPVFREIIQVLRL